MSGIGLPVRSGVHRGSLPASWWVERFVAAGFTREPKIEHAVHAKYDTYMERITPARLAFFVFAKSPSAARQSTIVQRIATQPFRALEISR
jgi:hypothetical protein